MSFPVHFSFFEVWWLLVSLSLSFVYLLHVFVLYNIYNSLFYIDCFKLATTNVLMHSNALNVYPLLHILCLEMTICIFLSCSSLKYYSQLFFSSVQLSSVSQSCPTLCDPMNWSMPGLPIHHQLPEFTQTQIHRVSDAIQPSHPLSSPSPPAPNPSQHQSLFQWVNSSHEVAKLLEFQL